MTKRKIILLATSICLVAILVAGATLAFFTDTDDATNVFTAGNVKIQLIETFDEDNAVLYPTTGKDDNGKIINAVEKVVDVKNIGTSDAFVRVHIAIPAILDDGDPSFDASQNVLHFNFTEDSIAEGLWSWEGASSDWNYYTTTVDDVLYNVYVVTYGTALAADETTAQPAMFQVYLDKKVTNEDVAAINEQLGDNWQIIVIAEGTQAAGFADAMTALDESFGVPGTAGYDPFN